MKTNIQGFTLLEIVVAILIVAILATVGLPRYTGMLERSRAAEGTYTLGTLLSAQERYFLENSAFTGNYGNLDVDIPTLKNFQELTVYATCAINSQCASLKRKTLSYTISINRNGVISCTNLAGSPTCAEAGF